MVKSCIKNKITKGFFENANDLNHEVTCIIVSFFGFRANNLIIYLNIQPQRHFYLKLY